MSVFTKSELTYLLGERRLARVATVGPDGTPHVMPVGWSYNPDHATIDIGGMNLERSKKFRDVQRTARAAVVIDDLASTDPWRPRGIEVRGRAEIANGVIRLHPERIISWGLDSDILGRYNARTIAPA
jgi:pyridoxamine 5'-phosphate oxidase family protein